MLEALCFLLGSVSLRTTSIILLATCFPLLPRSACPLHHPSSRSQTVCKFEASRTVVPPRALYVLFPLQGDASLHHWGLFSSTQAPFPLFPGGLIRSGVFCNLYRVSRLWFPNCVGSIVSFVAGSQHTCTHIKKLYHLACFCGWVIVSFTPELRFDDTMLHFVFLGWSSLFIL